MRNLGAACTPASAHAPHRPAGPTGPPVSQGARRGHLPGSRPQPESVAPQGSLTQAPSSSSVPLSAWPVVLLGTIPICTSDSFPISSPQITRPARPRPQGPSVAPAPLAAAPSSWVHDRLRREPEQGGGAGGVALLRDAGCHEKPPHSASPAPTSSPCPPCALAAPAPPQPEHTGGHRVSLADAGFP